MVKADKPLTAKSSIGDWLKHPVGGPLLGHARGGRPGREGARARPSVLVAAAYEWVERIVPERFAGKTVIVTGAGSGIGRATASRVPSDGGWSVQ